LSTGKFRTLHPFLTVVGLSSIHASFFDVRAGKQFRTNVSGGNISYTKQTCCQEKSGGFRFMKTTAPAFPAEKMIGAEVSA